jgi:hypothetical protein
MPVETIEVEVRKPLKKRVAWFGPVHEFVEMFEAAQSPVWYSYPNVKVAFIQYEDWNVDFYRTNLDPDHLRGVKYDLAYYPDYISDWLKEEIQLRLAYSGGKRIILKEKGYGIIENNMYRYSNVHHFCCHCVELLSRSQRAGNIVQHVHWAWGAILDSKICNKGWVK